MQALKVCMSSFRSTYSSRSPESRVQTSLISTRCRTQYFVTLERKPPPLPFLLTTLFQPLHPALIPPSFLLRSCIRSNISVEIRHLSCIVLRAATLAAEPLVFRINPPDPFLCKLPNLRARSTYSYASKLILTHLCPHNPRNGTEILGYTVWERAVTYSSSQIRSDTKPELCRQQCR